MGTRRVSSSNQGVGQLSFRQLDNTGNDPCVFFTRVLHL